MASLTLDDFTEEQIVSRLCNFLELRMPRGQEDLYYLMSYQPSEQEIGQVRNPRERSTLR